MRGSMKGEFAELGNFIDFAYVDLKTIASKRKRELLKWLIVGVEWKSEKMPVEAEKNMLSLQLHLLVLIKQLDQSIMFARLRHKSIQQQGGDIPTKESNPIVWAETVKVTMSCVVGQKNSWEIPFDECKISTTSLYQDEIMRVLESRFYNAANNLPVNALRQCFECEHYFVHTSKREKIYCSNKCAAKKNARDKRAELKKEKGHEYKQVLADGRKRAKKSYAKRIKTKDDSESQKVDRSPFNNKNREEEEP